MHFHTSRLEILYKELSLCNLYLNSCSHIDCSARDVSGVGTSNIVCGLGNILGISNVTHCSIHRTESTWYANGDIWKTFIKTVTNDERFDIPLSMQRGEDEHQPIPEEEKTVTEGVTHTLVK